MAARAAAAALALALLAAAAGPAAALPPGSSVAAAVLGSSLNAQGQPLLTPSKYRAFNRDVYWEMPSRPIGVLALFHGCAHDASDFWPRQACAECDGLPEEVAHTKQALARGYVVVAIDAAPETVTRCFGIHADKAAVVAILQAWLRQQGLAPLPLFLLGVSSGAAFALKLPMELAAAGTPVHGVISEVLGVLPDTWSMEELGGRYPPTAFLSMPRDLVTADRIAQDMALLRRYGVPTDMALVYSRPLALDFISNRSEVITPEVSAKVVAALQSVGLVDSSLLLTEDPRYSRLPWRDAVRAQVTEIAAAQECLEADASHVSEELNVAFGKHEIVGDYLTACLAWLEARGALPLPGLVQQFASILLPGERLRDLAPQRLRMLPMRARGAAALAL